MKRMNLKGISIDEGEDQNDSNLTTAKTTKTTKPATTTPSSSSSTPMTQFQHHTAINAPPKTSDKGRRKSKKKAEPYVEPDELYRRQNEVVAMTKGVHGQTNFSRNQTPGFSVHAIPVKSVAAKAAPPAKLSSAKISSTSTSSAPIPTPTLSVSSNPTPANSPSLRET
jgi:hypothetical protein